MYGVLSKGIRHTETTKDDRNWASGYWNSQIQTFKNYSYHIQRETKLRILAEHRKLKKKSNGNAGNEKSVTESNPRRYVYID